MVHLFFFFFPFSLVPMESISLTRVENKSLIFCHNRYAAQNKLPMHHSLPVCISLGSGVPISTSKSTNQFCITIQGQPLCWHHTLLVAVLVRFRFCHMDVCPLGNPDYAYQLIWDIPWLPFPRELCFHQQTAEAGLFGFFFPFHMDTWPILSPRRLLLPRAHKIDTQREDEIFQQER